MICRVQQHAVKYTVSLAVALNLAYKHTSDVNILSARKQMTLEKEKFGVGLFRIP